MNYNDEIIAQSRVATPVGTPTWSPLENCAVIAPNAVSAAYDGSCWATSIIHPCALDCGGDPNSCFVADFEGNKIVKLSASGSAVASQVKYYRPISVKVQRTSVEAPGGGYTTAEFAWVADRWNMEGTPNPQGTWTPYPTSTPSPQPTSTVPAGSPTFTPIPDFTPTPYPMIQRVSQNRFGQPQTLMQASSIPLMLSPKGDVNNSDCWIADRNGGFFRKNVIRRFKIRNGQPAELITYPAVGTPVQIVLPVDVEAVGNPVD